VERDAQVGRIILVVAVATVAMLAAVSYHARPDNRMICSIAKYCWHPDRGGKPQSASMRVDRIER